MATGLRSELQYAAMALAIAACTPAPADKLGTPLEQGRTYTAWLYQRQYDKLWARFTPELRQTFRSAADLAAFAGRTVQQLGAEHGVPDEQVVASAPFQVYIRTASFDAARDRVLIQWSLANDGAVTGFVVRPVP